MMYSQHQLQRRRQKTPTPRPIPPPAIDRFQFDEVLVLPSSSSRESRPVIPPLLHCDGRSIYAGSNANFESRLRNVADVRMTSRDASGTNCRRGRTEDVTLVVSGGKHTFRCTASLDDPSSYSRRRRELESFVAGLESAHRTATAKRGDGKRDASSSSSSSSFRRHKHYDGEYSFEEHRGGGTTRGGGGEGKRREEARVPRDERGRWCRSRPRTMARPTCPPRGRGSTRRRAPSDRRRRRERA